MGEDKPFKFHYLACDIRYIREKRPINLPEHSAIVKQQNDFLYNKNLIPLEDYFFKFSKFKPPKGSLIGPVCLAI